MPPCCLSIVIPCFNEEKTLQPCVDALLDAFHSADGIRLEVIIVDDCSTDQSLAIAQRIASQHPEVRVERHVKNRGKGAALRSGFQRATGDFVAIQDADLEYDPNDLVRLLNPLREGKADVVYGSRFLSGGAQRRLRFYEMGVSYFGRTYEEGKKSACAMALDRCTASSNTTARSNRMNCPGPWPTVASSSAMPGLIEHDLVDRDKERSPMVGLRIWLLPVFLGAVLALQFLGGAFTSEFSSFPDEPAHLVTGLMAHDFLWSGNWREPIAYAENYYIHYPKVSIGH